MAKIMPKNFDTSASNSANACFITGTDTGVGKTLIAASLIQGSRDLRNAWTYWKPIQTGFPDDDQSAVKELLAGDLAVMSNSFVYKKPASPNQAAIAEGQPAPDLGSLSKAFSEYFYQNAPQPLLIEGAGGLLVPLNPHFETWLNWLQEVRVPTLVVARSGLGTLNHTALTLRQLNQEAIPILGVVLNGLIHPENLQSLQEWFPDIAFHQFPYLENIHHQKPYWHQQSRLLAEWVENQRANYQTLKKSPDWLQADQKHCWHPYTQHKTSPKALPIIRAKGVWLEAADGQQYLDGISSWWTNTIGHGHPAIGHAIAKQQATLDHVLFAGVTHQAASLLSEKLSILTEHQIPRVFYTDNGSCAVEVALKIALQRWTNQGTNHRRKILSFQGSYHGDTFGTMAVAAADSFHGTFRDMLFQPLLATPATIHPTHYNPLGKAALNQRLNELRQLFKQHHEELACALIEPMVQGSSGMNIQDESWLQELNQLCQQYKIPLILDEVFTGMGRFGANFVYQRVNLQPAIICLAKGLTGGNLPLGVTMVQEEIFQDFYADDRGKALYHGHTYTANPIACRAALATLQVYESQGCTARSLALENAFQGWLNKNEIPLKLENARCYGSMMAWEMPGSGVGTYFNKEASQITQLALKHHLMLRPLGNTLYFLPPLTISDQELEFVFGALADLMNEYLSG